MSDSFEDLAAALIGRRVRINANAGPNGSQLILGGNPNADPDWSEGTVDDMKSSRGGCRHRVAYDSGVTEW